MATIEKAADYDGFALVVAHEEALVLFHALLCYRNGLLNKSWDLESLGMYDAVRAVRLRDVVVTELLDDLRAVGFRTEEGRVAEAKARGLPDLAVEEEVETLQPTNPVLLQPAEAEDNVVNELAPAEISDPEKITGSQEEARPELLTLEDYTAARELVMQYGWDEKKWGDDVDPRVLAVLDVVREHQWPGAKEMIVGEGVSYLAHPVEAPSEPEDSPESEAPPEPPDRPEEAPASTWAGYDLNLKGEALPEDIPYRGTLISRELTLGEIRAAWKEGVPGLKRIKGIGGQGAEKLAAWFASKDASGGVSEDVEDALSLLLKGALVETPRGALMELIPGPAGYRLGLIDQQTELGQTVPAEGEAAAPKDWVIKVARILLIGATVEEALEAAGPEQEPVDEEQAPENPPEPAQAREAEAGDTVAVQIPESPARALTIAGVTALEPHRARLVDEDGKTVGAVMVDDLTWLVGVGGWTVPGQKVRWVASTAQR